MSTISINPPLTGGEDAEVRHRLHIKKPNILLLAILASLTLAAVLILTEGKFMTAAAILIAGFVIFITVYRIDWGFYIFLSSVLLLDQYTVPGFEPITWQVAYFRNLKESYLLNVEPAVFNPLELHLLLIIAVWILTIALRKNVAFRRVPIWFSALLFFAALMYSFLSGLNKGGEFLPALWEVRALFYLGILYFFVPQIIQTKPQVTAVMWICIITISFKALQGIDRFVRLGFSFQGIPALTSHEDAAFFSTLVIFLLALALFGGHKYQRRTLVLLLLPLIMGFIVSQRRSAIGSMGASLIALILLIPWKERWKLLKVIIPIIIVFGGYLAVFWNSELGIAKPAELVRTSFSNDRESAGERYWSNLYRVYERYNLAVTIRHSPLVGIGFGSKYEMPIRLAEIDYSLHDYIAHNEVLWLLAKMGALGFFTFLLYLNSFIFAGSSVFSRLKDPYLKAVCAVAIIAIINQIFVSFFDLQLTFHRNMVYLGVLMGLLPTLEYIDAQNPELSSEELRSGGGGDQAG